MNKNEHLIQKVISDYEVAITKIILFCLTELPFSLGINKTITVLKGTKSTFVINNHLNQMTTFSVLSSFSKYQLKTIIEILIQTGLIKVENVSDYGNMPVIRITEKGNNYLNGNEDIQILILDALIDTEIPEFNDLERNLFTKLRTLRRELSHQKDLPAFTICGDQALRELCFKKPTDRQQLISIKGIGDKFAENYGALFLETIDKINAQ